MLSVEPLPVVSKDDLRRPSLRLPVREEPLAHSPLRNEVELSVGSNKLQVNKITGPIARPGQRVQLPSDLMIKRHERYPAGRRQPNPSKEHGDISKIDPVHGVRVAHFVVPDLKWNRTLFITAVGRDLPRQSARFFRQMNAP